MILNKANSRGYDHVRLEIRNQMNSGMGVVDIDQEGRGGKQWRGDQSCVTASIVFCAA